jgi:hypothetical protein
MDAQKRRLDPVDRDVFAGTARLSFTVLATRSGHHQFTALLKKGEGIEQVLTFRSWEEE